MKIKVIICLIAFILFIIIGCKISDNVKTARNVQNDVLTISETCDTTYVADTNIN